MTDSLGKTKRVKNKHLELDALYTLLNKAALPAFQTGNILHRAVIGQMKISAPDELLHKGAVKHMHGDIGALEAQGAVRAAAQQPAQR